MVTLTHTHPPTRAHTAHARTHTHPHRARARANKHTHKQPILSFARRKHLVGTVTDDSPRSCGCGLRDLDRTPVAPTALDCGDLH